MKCATLAIVRPIVEFPQGDALRAGRRPGPDWTPKRSRQERAAKRKEENKGWYCVCTHG